MSFPVDPPHGADALRRQALRPAADGSRSSIIHADDDFHARARALFTEETTHDRTTGLTRHGGRLAAIAATGGADRRRSSCCRPRPRPIRRRCIATYADIALAKYEDALTTAKALDAAVDALIAKPSAETLAAAREAWKAARIPYQQTEVYRFGNAIVDDWEGRVNAWPLDEGLIDYVDASYGTESDENTLYTANVIANPSIEINGKKVDASKITPEFLSGTLQEAGDIEANVATGYHAIEFLLWGQDLNGTGPGAGDRPYTDYDTANCTGGNCDRRAALSRRRDRPAGHRPRGDGRQLEGRRRRPQGPARRRCRRPASRPSSPAWARCPMANWPASA